LQENPELYIIQGIRNDHYTPGNPAGLTGHTHFLARAGKISCMETEIQADQIVYETSILSKDKNAINIAFLTIRFPHLLLEKKLDDNLLKVANQNKKINCSHTKFFVKSPWNTSGIHL
jgi:hypothetical protein